MYVLAILFIFFKEINIIWTANIKKFEKIKKKKLRKIIEYNPNILKVVKTLGSWDFILYIVANNHRHFHETMKEIIHELSETISNYETLLAYKEHMYNPMPQIISKVFNKW